MALALVIASVSSAAIIVILLLIFKKAGNSKGHSGFSSSTYSDTEDESLSILKHSTNQEEELEGVEFANYLENSRPSPERPITDEDAALIDIIRQSPELPSAIMELSHLLSDPETSIKRIVQLVSTDPVLSSKVLRVVNSAAFCTQRITSLQHAVVILGFNELWILVNQLLAHSALRSLAEISHSEIKALWRHAAATATCAKHVLFKMGSKANEIGPTVITCSLLHDVGKFLLRGLSPEHGQDEDSEEEQCSLVSVVKEDQAYGIDHCRMAYLLTTYWKLPEILCTTISYHHHPSFSNWEDIPTHAKLPTALVALSDQLANVAGYWDSKPCTMAIHPEFLESIGLDKNWSPNRLLTKDLIQDLKDTERLIETAASL